MLHRNNAIEKIVEGMDKESFVDIIVAMDEVQEDTTDIQNGIDAGDDTAGRNDNRTSENEDQEKSWRLWGKTVKVVLATVLSVETLVSKIR